jgi:hypothetical protein
MVELAASKNIIKPLLPRAAKLRCSLYADDAAIFANLERKELQRIGQLLHTFGECSGLKINMTKTEMSVAPPKTFQML